MAIFSSSRQQCLLCNKKASELTQAPMYYYCTSCELAWLKKLPKAEYSEGYYTPKSGLVRRLFSPIQSFFYWLRTWYANRKNVGLWIDVGAGDGGYLTSVTAKRRIGVEISKAARDIMQKKGLETLTDQEFLKNRSLKADAISFWHVLEHVDNPIEYLKAAKRHLKPGGIIICGVPNIDSFEFKLFGLKWFHLVPQYHFWHFTPASFSELLKRSGFTVRSIDYLSPEHHLAGVLQSLLNVSSKNQNTLQKLIKRGEGSSHLPIPDIFWSVFWITAGVPVVILFWLINALAKKSGTIVVASVQSL